MNYFEKTLEHLRLFGNKTGFGLTMPRPANARQWIERIENELSPENLTCDGELSSTQVSKKAAELNRALAHCHSLLSASELQPGVGCRVDEGAKDGLSILDTILGGLSSRNRRRIQHPMFRQARQRRTEERMDKLNAAVGAGFTIGVRVRLSNGLRGKIVKINRTRVQVRTDDQKTWNVPPRCMELERIVR
jgi:hypothetical protein